MFGSLIDAAGARYGDRLAFVIPDRASLSYHQLADRVRERAAQLADAGIGPEAVVALQLDSDEHYLVTALAVQAIGGICAGVSPVLTATEADRLITHLEPSLLVDAQWIAAAPRTNTQPNWPLPSPEAPCAIVFTSGTTGAPKGALFRQRQITAIMRADLGGIFHGVFHADAATLLHTDAQAGNAVPRHQPVDLRYCGRGHGQRRLAGNAEHCRASFT